MNRFLPGDRLLVRKPGLAGIGSSLICWWLNSRFSHCVPVVSEGGLTMDARWPRVEKGHVADYLGYEILHLRPSRPFDASAWVARAMEMEGTGYDLMSYLGFVANKTDLERRRQVNCAELLLALDHAGGLLPGRDMGLISPQSYVEFMSAGMFSVVHPG